MSRDDLPKTIQINADHGRVLQILVENRGRVSFGVTFNIDFKGILGDVLLNDKKIENWNITGYPFANGAHLNDLPNIVEYIENERDEMKKIEDRNSEQLTTDPIIFEGTFDVANGEINDTYIDTSGWGKVRIFFFHFMID